MVGSRAIPFQSGQFYTGNFNRLFFVADQDGGAQNGNSYFKNIKIYEGSGCGRLSGRYWNRQI